MTLLLSDYKAIQSISYVSTATGEQVTIGPRDVVAVVVDANKYLVALQDLFAPLSFEVYRELGQRNLSGFVGEVFTNFFAKRVHDFRVNPHADGRPDLLDLSSPVALQHLTRDCLIQTEEGYSMPVRALLAPFKYGGIEVKSSIGSPVANYKARLTQSRGVTGFQVGEARVDYLGSITFWGHHTSCGSLLGLYYDYSAIHDGAPQIMAVMYAQLNPEVDWHVVSTGKAGSKKTSNTSLTPSGQAKLMAGVVAIRNDPRYLSKLHECGLRI